MENTETVPQEKFFHMEIDTRKAEWWRNTVKIGEVIHAVEKEHRDDITKSVNFLKGQFGVYKLDADDFTRYIDKTVVIRGIEIPFTPRKYKERRHNLFAPEKREGTLVTIYDAYERVFRHFPNEDFDEYFDGIEGIEVIKMTQPQRSKGTNVLNNNRFVVLKKVGENNNKMDIGTSIQIRGITFNLRYNGMEKYCYLSKGKYGSECPTQVR